MPYLYKYAVDLTAEKSRPVDFTIRSVGDWDQINNPDYQTIEVEPGDWSGVPAITLATSGTAGNRKIIRAQRVSNAVPGIDNHPFYLPSFERTVFPPTTNVNMNCNHLVLSGFQFSSSLTFNPWPRGNAFNNDIIIDRYMFVDQPWAGGGVVYFKYGASGCRRQYAYYENCSVDGEGAALALGSENGGESYTDCHDVCIEVHDHNQLSQWVQQEDNDTNPSDFSGYKLEHCVLHYDPAKRTDKNGNTVGASGAYSPFECGYLEAKGAATNASNRAVVIDGLLVGGRNCNDEGPNQSQISGLKHPAGNLDKYSALSNLTIDGLTVVDSNFFAQYYYGSSPNLSFKNVTGFQCGVFAEDNSASHLNDSPKLVELRNLDGTCEVIDTRLIDSVSSGVNIALHESGYTDTRNVEGTSASLSGNDRVVYDLPISNPTHTITIPKGDSLERQTDTGSLDFPININNGAQSFELGRPINNIGRHGGTVQNTLIGGGWIGFSPPGAKTVNGSRVGTTRQDKLDSILDFANTIKDKPGASGMLVYGRWKDYEDGLGDYDTELMNGLAAVIAALKSGGKQFGFALDFKKFYANAASESPVPSYIFGSGYGVSWSTSATQQVATAAVWRPAVRDRVMALINELTGRYGADIHLITVGETSISSVESDFNFSAWNSTFRHFMSEIQALIPHGAFLAEINFFGNNNSDIINLINYAISIGAVCISLPDWLSSRASWTSRQDPRYHYNIATYDIIRDNFRKKIRFFPHWQSWDAELTENWNDFEQSLALLADVDGFGMIATHDFTSRVQEHVTGSIYYSGNYRNDIVWPTFAGANFSDYFYQDAIEASEYNSGDGGVSSGINPQHIDYSFLGSVATFTPRASAVAGTSENFTIEFADAIGTDESATATYSGTTQNTDGDGTPTLAAYWPLKPGVDNITNDTLNGSYWQINQTHVPGYSGDGVARAAGDQRVTAGQTGSMKFDVTHIPAGSRKIWAHTAGFNVNQDSFFLRVQVDGSWGPWETVYIPVDKHGSLYWRELATEIDSRADLIEMATRENETVVNLLMISGASEIPTGKDGFIPLVVTNNPPVAAADSYSVRVNTTVQFDVTANDTDIDGDAVELLDIYEQPQLGSAQIVSGRIEYSAPANAGDDTLAYRISDQPGSLVIGYVSIVVEPDEQLPPDVVAPDIERVRISDGSDSIEIDLSKYAFDKNGREVRYGYDNSNVPSVGSVDLESATSGLLTWNGITNAEAIETVGYQVWTADGESAVFSGTITLKSIEPTDLPDDYNPGSDVKVDWHGQDADASMDGFDLSGESGLRTAVILSLFADRRAERDDQVDDGDERGWWADVFGDRVIGSRLWLLDREKDLPEIVNKAYDYAHEALDWLQEDGIAKAVEVDVTSENPEHLEINVRIIRPDDELLSMKFQRRWESEAER